MRKTRAVQVPNAAANTQPVSSSPVDDPQEEETVQFVPIVPHTSTGDRSRVGPQRLGRWDPPDRLYNQ